MTIYVDYLGYKMFDMFIKDHHDGSRGCVFCNSLKGGDSDGKKESSKSSEGDSMEKFFQHGQKSNP